MRGVSLAAMLLLAVLTAGCLSGRSGPQTDRLTLEVGRTKLGEVIAAWGNPDSIKRGLGVWKQAVSRGGKVKAAYMMVGMTISNRHVVSREYRLGFTSEGVLKSVEVARAVPDGAKWSVWPW